MPNDYTLNVTAKLDSENLADQIKSVGQSTTLTISKIKLDGAEISGTISKALQDGMTDIKLGGSATSNLVKEAKSAGTTAGKELTDAINKQTGEIRIDVDTKSFTEASSKIKNVNEALKRLNFEDSDIAKVTQKFEEMNAVVTSVTSSLKNGRLNVTVKGQDELNRVVTLVEQFNDEANEGAGAWERTGITIAQSFTNASKGLSDAGTSAAALNKQYKELMSVAKELGNLNTQVEILGLQGGNEQEISVLNNQIDELTEKYNELFAAFEQNPGSFGLDEIQAAAQASTTAIDEFKAKLVDTLNTDLSNGTLANAFDKVEVQMNALADESGDVHAKFAELDTAFQGLSTALNSGDVNGAIKAYQEYKNALKETQNQIEITARQEKEATNATKEAAKAQKELADAEKLAANASKLSNDISTWMSNNTKAADQFEGELTDLQNRLQNVSSTADLSAISAEFRNIQAEAKSAGMATSSFAQELGHAALQAVGLGTTMQVVSKAISMIKSGIEIVKDLDAAMAQLQIVTGATESEMNQFLEQSISLAKELGQSVDDILDSITVFSRLGYDLEDASELTEYASILSNVAGVELSEGTEGLTSVIKGFGMSVDEAEHIADVLVTVGNNYAVSASEILEAMEKSSAAFAATSTSFEEASAIIAAGNAAVQDASTVGTAMKTVSARIRGATTELEELGEDSEEIAAGFSKYADELEKLTGFSILEEGTTDTYKDIYEIFDGIAAVWDQLSDTTQSRVSEILGGTRQLQVISSIMANWDDAVDAYAQSMDSAGVAIEANVVYMETLEAKNCLVA